ncbi:MAG: hypothetical protein RMJ33_01080 [Saprospiraceae bacterium]|nr:hypothetical protein [Saprospiraceae bacterium]MDW8228402.1 hypothetical protein [Saprospiraceae bacterium]
MERLALTGLIGALSALMLLHIAVLLGWLPYDKVWGGRLKRRRDMYRFEALSLLLSLVFLSIALQRAGLSIGLPNGAVRYGLWFIGILFAASTLGNLLSKNSFERWVMTPLALVMGACAFWLAAH